MSNKHVHVKLNRILMTERGTIGAFSISGRFVCFCIERPWLDNERNVSCIPEGMYALDWRNSPKFGKRLHVLDVPDRSHILIHVGNAQDESLGCLMPATTVGIAADEFHHFGCPGCYGENSRVALRKLEAVIPENESGHLLTITNAPDMRIQA